MKYCVSITNIKWDTSDWTEEEELASGVCVPDLPSECTFTTKSTTEEEVIEELEKMYETDVVSCDVAFID